MRELDLQVASAPLDATVEPVSIGEDPDTVQVRERGEAMSVLSLGEVDEATVLIEAENGTNTSAVAMRSFTLAQINMEGILSNSISEAKSLEELEFEAQTIVNKVREAQDAPLTVETELMTGDTSIDTLENRSARNLAWAEQMIAEKVRVLSEDTSLLGKVGGFVDRFFIRQLIVGAYEDVTNRTGRMGREILAMSIAAESDEEFQAFFTEKVTLMQEEGFFDRDNLFAMMQLQEAASNRGENPHEALDRAFGVLDFATLGLSAVSRVPKFSTLRSLQTAETQLKKIAAI